MNQDRLSPHRLLRSHGSRLFLAAIATLLLCAPGYTVSQQPQPAANATTSTPGTPFTPQALATLLPPSVYFQGKTASLQLRNAGGTNFGNGAILWAALVDTSGYASDIQNRYQFYLVTESPLKLEGKQIPAGAYGGGFVGDQFVLMDIGGHTVAEGSLHNDPDLRRPRPLQVLPVSADAVKLYLGRHWILLSSAEATSPQ